MMFVMQLPIMEEEYIQPKKRRHVLTEQEYFSKDQEKLKDLKCPNCGDVGFLFRGFVFIGCTSCINFFDEKELIEANI